MISKSGNWFTCPTAGGIDYSKHVFSAMEEATKFANQNMIPINNIDTIHLLPKGEYFIGDPLHAFKRKFDYLEEFFPSQKGGGSINCRLENNLQFSRRFWVMESTMIMLETAISWIPQK